MKMILAVALGGALGASGRYLVAHQALRLLGPNFPWGTLAVNVVGSLAMGILIELLALKVSLAPEVRAFLVTGLLGGFTTFSAFSLDTAILFERHAHGLAAAYVLASLVRLGRRALPRALGGPRVARLRRGRAGAPGRDLLSLGRFFSAARDEERHGHQGAAVRQGRHAARLFRHLDAGQLGGRPGARRGRRGSGRAAPSAHRLRQGARRGAGRLPSWPPARRRISPRPGPRCCRTARSRRRRSRSTASSSTAAVATPWLFPGWRR